MYSSLVVFANGFYILVIALPKVSNSVLICVFILSLFSLTTDALDFLSSFFSLVPSSASSTPENLTFCLPWSFSLLVVFSWSFSFPGEFSSLSSEKCDFDLYSFNSIGFLDFFFKDFFDNSFLELLVDILLVIFSSCLSFSSSLTVNSWTNCPSSLPSSSFISSSSSDSSSDSTDELSELKSSLI